MNFKPLAYREVIKKARKEIKSGTLKSIINQMGLSEEEFKDL